AVVPLDSRFADQPCRTYPNRPLPVLSEFDDVRLVLSMRWRKTYSNHRFLVGPEGQYELASCVPSGRTGQSRDMPEMRRHSASNSSCVLRSAAIGFGARGR